MKFGRRGFALPASARPSFRRARLQKKFIAKILKIGYIFCEESNNFSQSIKKV